MRQAPAAELVDRPSTTPRSWATPWRSSPPTCRQVGKQPSLAAKLADVDSVQ